MSLSREQHDAVRDELDKLIGEFLIWKARELTGNFPSKIRFNMIFPGDDEQPPHFFEAEWRYPPEVCTQAEELFQKWEKEDIVRAAAGFLKGREKE